MRLLFYALIALVLIGWITSCSPAFAEQAPNWDKLVHAINRVENGASLSKGELFGIHSVHYADRAEARAICMRTVKRQWARKPGFEALAKRYCPVNWKRWKYMVEFYYFRFLSA